MTLRARTRVSGAVSQFMQGHHTGVDIAAPYGSGLAASVNGTVSQNGWVAVGGLHICVQSGNLEECYFHLSAAYASVGTAVAAGQIIAAIGLTGVTTGPHVHWETRIDGRLVNSGFVGTALAIATAYLGSGADRLAYMRAVALTACKFQDDPHNQKITHSTFEEYGHNSTHLRDNLLLATARLLAGWTKMPGERECYARFMSEWIG